MSVSVVLLAGGTGSRMQMTTPKQFLPLRNKPILSHSLEVFLHHPDVCEVIVVANEVYRSLFSAYNPLHAEPGERRQDSLYNGLQKVSKKAKWVCVHDAARPFITHALLDTLFAEGKKVGAATLGVPIKWTIKEATTEGAILKTLNREHIYEIQTPQFLEKTLLEKGFAHANQHAITVTDDVSFAELLGHPVQLVQGSYRNIKITTPDDLYLAECIITNLS